MEENRRWPTLAGLSVRFRSAAFCRGPSPSPSRRAVRAGGTLWPRRTGMIGILAGIGPPKAAPTILVGKCTEGNGPAQNFARVANPLPEPARPRRQRPVYSAENQGGSEAILER